MKKISLDAYRTKKLESTLAESNSATRFRAVCRNCRKATSTCYCARIKPFTSAPEFVILIHPKENRKRVGTGRLTHLCIKNSILLEGVDFSRHPVVDAILADESRWPMVLYPGPGSVDVSADATAKLESLVPSSKKLVLFVIDGSWFCAKKMLRVSRNLSKLPQLKFTPPNRSIYQIRRQPKAICFSTLEAVHFMIDQLSGSKRWPCDQPRAHGNLLEVFRFMIDQQLAHVSEPGQRAVRGDRSR